MSEVTHNQAFISFIKITYLYFYIIFCFIVNIYKKGKYFFFSSTVRSSRRGENLAWEIFCYKWKTASVFAGKKGENGFDTATFGSGRRSN